VKELFDGLRAESQKVPLPDPAQVRLRSDRRAVRRTVAIALSMTMVVGGGFLGAKPLLIRIGPGVQGGIGPQPMVLPETAHTPLTKVVPNVVGLTQESAKALLSQQGFQVRVQPGSTLKATDPNAGKVEIQDPPGQALDPAKTVVTIWITSSRLDPANCDDAFPRKIADTVFVAGGDEVCFRPKKAEFYLEAIPAPCWPAAFTSDAQIEDRRGFDTAVGEEAKNNASPAVPSAGPPGTARINQTVTKYRADGAAAYLTELTAAIARCEPVQHTGFRLAYTIAKDQSPAIGEQSLYLQVDNRLDKKPETGPQSTTYLIILVRVGAYIAVVYDRGWDRTPTKRPTLVQMAQQLAMKLISSPAPAR
jgi:hypothetical protein